MPLGMELGFSPGDFVRPLNFGHMFIIAIVSCRTRVKRLYTCAQIQYVCFSNYLGNPVTLLTLFMLK